MKTINYFQEAYQEAEKAKGVSRPNPAVGAIIVKNGKIIGRGHTSEWGGPHAEVNAVLSVKNKKQLVDSDIYVTLTPCCHTGKTPACTDMILTHKLKRVHIANRDPHAKVFRISDSILIKNRVEVLYDFPQEIQEKVFELNKDFYFSIIKERPFISLKYAITLDGKMATSTGDSKWITCEEARQQAHIIRRNHDAVVVAIGTVLADNPSLTIRLLNYKGLQPVRIVIDKDGQTPFDFNLFNNEAKTIFVTKNGVSPQFVEEIRKRGHFHEQFLLINGRFFLPEIFQVLAKKYNLNSIMVEGGSTLLGSLIRTNIVSKIEVFIAPRILGDGTSGCSPFTKNGTVSLMQDCLNLHHVKYSTVGTDFHVSGYFNLSEIDSIRKVVIPH